ncbi:Transcriptional regulatory protein, C terminal [Chryseobacterium soldanellicola]|uniref:Transcriptional regulatory protein, C terminal n=1 Tax=Chryseobacterium soldanellicola TaxID=311333 RepID=A0A1H1DV77_9FLAO|nr:winged helix-turn-helix domain-containing protein [Chryseobacterium soldanellicola]SDQ80169.1 Transcriptional regulatory protein, C terminal [Chryseobacterium soldanellicola]
MNLSRNLLSGKRKYLFGLLFLSLICIICAAFSSENSKDFDFARREVLLRRIGHEILLQSGDRTSRVLPIKKISENEYQISFENKLSFQPDSLVNTTQRLLAKDPFTSDYVVSVLNCNSSGVAYGYAISKNKQDDVVPCRGRKQPVACYIINIKFKPAGINVAKSGYLLGGLSILAFVGFIFLRSKSINPRKVLPENEQTHQTHLFALGSVLFDAKNRKLSIDEKMTDLTATESRVLLIFALSPNEIIERSRLQKEIWEDDGVIVGRSLDMFISKLRKKLEIDPDIKIVVIRGKGYRLEIIA